MVYIPKNKKEGYIPAGVFSSLFFCCFFVGNNRITIAVGPIYAIAIWISSGGDKSSFIPATYSFYDVKVSAGCDESYTDEKSPA